MGNNIEAHWGSLNIPFAVGEHRLPDGSILEITQHDIDTREPLADNDLATLVDFAHAASDAPAEYKLGMVRKD